MSEETITSSFEETQKLGGDFAKKLHVGDAVALYGNLGAGKTTFVQGVAKEFGIDQKIASPTFIIIRQYEVDYNGIKTLYHIDLYRLETEQSIEELGIKEILSDPFAVVFIEWAEKIKGLLPKKRWEIHLEHVEGDKRKIRIEKN